MSSRWQRFKEWWSREWTAFRRMNTIKQCGFDPWEYQDRMKYLQGRVKQLEEEKSSLETKLSNQLQDIKDSGYVHSEDLDFYKNVHDEIVQLHNKFPVHIRKMWSGGEIVEWIRKEQYRILKKK